MQLVCSGESEGYRSSGASRIGVVVVVLHSSLFSACLFSACMPVPCLPACSLPVLGPGILGPGILGLACSLALSFSRALSLMEHRGTEASKHRSKEASKRRSLHEASKHWRIEVSKYRSIGSSSRGRRNSGVASISAAPCGRVRREAPTPAPTPEEVYLLPPPPLAAAIPPTRSMEAPRTAHGLPTEAPESPWSHLGVILGVLGGSWSSLATSQCPS